MSFLDFLFGGNSNNNANVYGPVQFPEAGTPGYHGTAEANALKNNAGGGNISSLLQLIPALMAGFKGLGTSGQNNTTSQLENVTNAMYNPTNPLYQQLYGQNKQMLQQNMGNAISQAEGQNRAMSAMGRTPLFSPERNGELAFRTMVQGQGAAGQAAQQQTESQLGNAGTMLSRGLYPIQQNNTENQFGNTALRLGGYQSLADVFRHWGA